MKQILGADVDGVLADFNTSFISFVIAQTGRDLFPPRPFDITTWNYPESYGYTADEMSRVWGAIEESDWFWSCLAPYDETNEAMAYLRDHQMAGNDVYFVTSRPGRTAKAQTEHWLGQWWGWGRTATIPTVLISSDKGLCAVALKMDVYIDDLWENVLDVAQTKTHAVLMDRPWNRAYVAEDFGIQRRSAVKSFAELGDNL